ncbi:hypothetical protein Q1695_013947 [Nippostrongylus brasiliensis]|nr:hypothetical protein Q1695_013947 [Nippostrongylus brasiliensis]
MKKGRRKSKPKKKKPTDSSTESIEGSIASSELESDESLVPPTPAPVGVVGTVRKKISVFAPRVGAASAKKSKKRTQSAEKLKQQKELDSKIDLIGQFVAAAVKVMSNSATGVDDVEVRIIEL